MLEYTNLFKNVSVYFQKKFAEQKHTIRQSRSKRTEGVNRHGLSNAYTHDSGKRRNGDCR